jgi:YidC/Oxa1 family membrane protein insertase
VFGEQPEYERYLPLMDFDLTPAGCFCDMPGARPMAQLLLWVLRRLHSLVGSWGLAIVLMTLLVRGSLVPLNFRMQKSMRAYGIKAARLKPRLDELKVRYSKDPKQYQAKMVEFQRENKMFPPLGGCLPMFITIPVFLGLFTALRVTYELRHQPFLGWIDDLSQPDHLFELGFDFLPWFNVLPVLMVVLWIVMQLGTPLPTDPQQRQMMKIMRWLPVVFGVFLFSYAAGLMVYMITSSLWGIGEQRITKRILGPLPADAVVAPMPQF